jgi:hypothetical protein
MPLDLMHSLTPHSVVVGNDRAEWNAMGGCGLDEPTQVEKVAQVLRGLQGYLRRIASSL